MINPKITIISAFRNGGEKAVSVVRSVLAQDYRNIQYCISDCESDDGSIDEILAIADERLDVVVRKDSGISDAWNNALQRADGDYIMFLGVGDYLLNSTLLNAMKLAESARADKRTILVGKCIRTDIETHKSAVSGRRYNRLWMPISMRFWFPTCLISRDAFTDVGLFDEAYRVGIDTDWLLRAVAKDYRFIYGDYYVEMESGGVSDRQKAASYNEYVTALGEHGFLNWYDRLVVALRKKLYEYHI